MQHWMINTPSTSNSDLSPSSRPLVLRKCPGCSLHTPAPTFTRGRHANDARLRNVSCLLVFPQDEVASLKDLFKGIS